MVLSALSIVFASVSVYWIVRIGHTGAKATWEKTQQQLERGGGERSERSGDYDDD